jgi:hypothetical protein
LLFCQFMIRRNEKARQSGPRSRHKRDTFCC